MSIENKIILQDQIKNVKQAEIKAKQKLMGTLKFRKGLTLWEINLKENTISQAEFEQNAIYVDGFKTQGKKGLVMATDKKTGDNKVLIVGQDFKRRKVMVKPDCVYIQAMNKKTALKKLIKLSS